MSGWDRFIEDVDRLSDDKPPVHPGTLESGKAAVREGNAGAAMASRRIGIGALDGLNRRQADQFRRGQYPIQARLDLHGHTAAAARAELARFIQSSVARNLRCVLVITGKGRDAMGSPRGVLRKSLEKWLNAPGIRHFVLACERAQPVDGGAGAFYLLLRRKRSRS